MSERRRVGGVAAVVAAFCVGFVCGGGGSLPGAAESREPLAAGRGPAPAAPPPGSASGPAVAPAAPAAPRGDPGSAQPPAGPASAAPGQDPPEPVSPPREDPAADGSTRADADPEMEGADPEMEGADPEMEGADPEPPLVQDRPRVFTANTGALLYFVRPEGESAFEDTMRRAAEALAASESEERRRQAEGWRTYRAEESLADGVLLYVSWLDPAVRGADYWIPDILNEAFPTEAQALYETYAGAFADGQILLNLTPVAGP